MWNHNRLTEILQISYPIIQAGMAGGITTPELVAAVSNAGGLGNVGAGYMNAEAMKKTIHEVYKLTDRPFGVNLFVPEFPETTAEQMDAAKELLSPIKKELGIGSTTKEDNVSPALFEEQINILLAESVPIVSFTFGIPPKNIIQQLKAAGKILVGTATTVEEAIINENSGMDIVVAQGSEAGGHRGTFSAPFAKAMIGTIALVPQTADHVTIPVIAAGGITDSRGVKAALALGAKGAQLGTAFLTSKESGAKKQHKEAIMSSTEDQPVMTKAFSGKPARGIENQFIMSMRQHEHNLPGYPVQNALTKDIRHAAAKQNNPEYMSLWSGQNPRGSRDITAAQIIEGISRNMK